MVRGATCNQKTKKMFSNEPPLQKLLVSLNSIPRVSERQMSLVSSIFKSVTAILHLVSAQKTQLENVSMRSQEMRLKFPTESSLSISAHCKLFRNELWRSRGKCTFRVGKYCIESNSAASFLRHTVASGMHGLLLCSGGCERRIVVRLELLFAQS